MSFPAFLYRRLARWITCEFSLDEQAKILLKNKYEVASFRDVFCHPFYWQVFNWIDSPPKLVVDCGAHCGHFTILADLCFKSKFGLSNTHYILVEPNPYLLPIAQKNLADAGMNARFDLKQGLLGEASGSGTLWINHKNYLATGTHSSLDTKPFEIPYLNLKEVVGSRKIDLLKLDIEGGEFDFVRSNLELFKQVNLIFMELHEASDDLHQELFSSLKSVGLSPVSKPLEANGQQLLVFQNQQN